MVLAPLVRADRAMDYRRVVLGIGNPGPEYEKTRHNAGFLVLDRLAARWGIEFRRLSRRAPDGTRLFSGKVRALVATGATEDGEPFLLVKPLTYVNLSGDVAGPLLRVAELSPEMLFVIVDDLNLPLGRIRVRPAGSAGGHNGLKSIEQALHSDAYPRLRLGIGQAEAAELDSADFVLAPFLPGEQRVLDTVLERCADVIDEWQAGTPIEDLMGRHNGFRADAEAETGPVDPTDDDPGDRES